MGVEEKSGGKEAAIVISHVNRIFPVAGGEFQALTDICAEIPRGVLTILKGRSGSGKTTLLNIVGALDTPTSGSVMIGGQDVCRLSGRERENLRRTKVGFVFQSVSLIPTMDAFQLSKSMIPTTPQFEASGFIVCPSGARVMITGSDIEFLRF